MSLSSLRARCLFPLFAALLALPAVFARAAPVGLYFTHGDWELACDNTGTCRAAGYHVDGDSQAISVLLTRKAGARQAVSGQVKLGQYGEHEVLAKRPKTFSLNLMINGRNLGPFAFDQQTLEAPLSASQVSALLNAVAGKGSVEWRNQQHQWQLSGNGATAVLLKMDEFQQRIDTRQALVKKGTQGEDGVLRAALPPVIQAAPVSSPKAADAKWLAKHEPALRAALKRSLPADDGCFNLSDPDGEAKPLTLARLSNTKLLVSTQCALAAYNESHGYWVIDDAPNFNPVPVTLEANDYAAGQISAAHKGRGLGDCLSLRTWVWDGRQFVLAEQSRTGMCKLMAPGGAWSLPILISEIQ